MICLITASKMLAYRALNRYVQNKLTHPTIFKCMVENYCSSSDSDDEKKKRKPGLNKQEQKVKSDEALKKLNVLLKQMIEDKDNTHASNKPALNLAKPKPRPSSNKNEVDTISSSSEQVEKQIISAAKNVAESLGGNTKQTESELLSKLLNTGADKSEETSTKPLNLSDVLSGMKIDRLAKPIVNNEASRAHQVRQLLDKTSRKQYNNDQSKNISNKRFTRKPTYSPQTERDKIDLFGTEPLGIFTAQSKDSEIEKSTEPVLKTWNYLEERELRLAVTHPPENYFQEMILWTQQGKVWKFPIDNEQGLEEEQNIYFAEHVFMDKHLESWCPTKGPIRHFMELVCVGLSKNCYLTVEAKKDHIMWYKDYFLSKKQLLVEIGAMSTDSVKQDTAQK